MARSKSAVLKGSKSRAVKKAEKLKELKAELVSVEKQIFKLDRQAGKLLGQIEKLETPKVTVVAEDGGGGVVTDGAGDSVVVAPAVEAQAA